MTRGIGTKCPFICNSGIIFRKNCFPGDGTTSFRYCKNNFKWFGYYRFLVVINQHGDINLFTRNISLSLLIIKLE